MSHLKKIIFNHSEGVWEGQNKSVPYIFGFKSRETNTHVLLILRLSDPGEVGGLKGSTLCHCLSQAVHTDPEQGAQGQELTNDDEYCSVYDLPKLDDWRKN